MEKPDGDDQGFSLTERATSVSTNFVFVDGKIGPDWMLDVTSASKQIKLSETKKEVDHLIRIGSASQSGTWDHDWVDSTTETSSVGVVGVDEISVVKCATTNAEACEPIEGKR